MAPKNTENRLKRVEALLGINIESALTTFEITNNRINNVKGKKDKDKGYELSVDEAKTKLIVAFGETIDEED